MKFLVNVAQALAGNMGIDFCCANGGMAEQFLNDAQVGAVFEQMCGKAMPKHVWSDIALDPGAANALLDAQPERDRCEWGSAPG